MDKPVERPLSPAALGRLLALLAALGGAGLAQGQGQGDRADRARTVEAERAVAIQELAAGRPLAAIERLERVLGVAAGGAARGGGAAIAPGTADAFGTLALAYERAGYGARAVAAAERAVEAGARDTAVLRARLALARGVLRDSAEAAGLPPVGPDSEPVTAALGDAWAQYGRHAFDSAAAAFGAAAAQMPSAVERWSVRLMQAQSALEARATAAAATLFRAVLDSARGLGSAAAGGAASGGAASGFARAAAERRALGVLWAGETSRGRLVARTAPGGDVRRVRRADAQAVLAALGPPAADPVVQALVWTVDADPAPAGGGAAALPLAVRALADSLGDADARVAHAAERLAALRAGRAGRLAEAARHVAQVRAMHDSLAVTEATVRGFGEAVARRDSAIAATLSDYKAQIVDKVNYSRSLARENMALLDSLADAARRAGDLTVRFREAERGAAAQYLAVADVAAQALDRGLARLDIVFRRDTVHQKLDRLEGALAAARAAYDSAVARALEAERAATATVDREIAAAEAEQGAATAARDGLAGRAGAAAAALLASRAEPLRARLAEIARAAQMGLANALFFAALEADTARANAAEVARRRDAGIAALGDVAGAAPQLTLALAELLTRKADADFAAAQRAGSGAAAAPERPDYGPALARYDELIRTAPGDPRVDAAAYTMGTLAFAMQRFDEAARALTLVMANAASPYRADAFFRHGDTQFEIASKLAGGPRVAAFLEAGRSYARAIELAPPGGDIYFLALYKLGWSEYMQAERQASEEYRRAVDVFARLVREVDALPPERQARLALRQEAIDYLAIAITQLGGADEAVRYLGSLPDVGTRMLVLRRVAHALRDQGEFNASVIAFRGALAQAPLHPAVLETRLELIELFQSRMLEPARAQEARLELADSLDAASAWARANPGRAAELRAARERALREAGSWALAQRQPAAAAPLFARYLAEFSDADSAQRVSALEGDARFGARDWFGSGVAYSRTATRWTGDSALAAAARRNAVVAFDSALAAERRAMRAAGRGAALDTAAARARLLEDSLFAATERFVAGATPADARHALVAMGRRAAEGERWDVVASAFTRVADGWPADALAPEARKFVGDARYREGRYAEAQAEWKRAYEIAAQRGRKALADSIVNVRVAAAAQAADSLVRQGAFVAAADSVLTAIAADIGDPARAADVLRNAVEVHLAADSMLRARGDSASRREAQAARGRAIAAIETLTARFPAYQHALAYAALRARLLTDVGRAAEAAAALQQLAEANPRWPGRADALVRAAVLLDSIGQAAPAAAAYERFSAAYPADRRAPDAQYNAAVILRDAGDPVGAARAFKAFVTRFPREARVPQANLARWAALKAAGDTVALNGELATLCAGWRPPATPAAATPYTPVCADRAGSAAFRAGMARWDQYVALALVIPTRAQLTRAGVDAAAAPKLQALRAMTQQFSRAVASGAPEWVAAGTFQTGLAQWHYGLFLRDVTLPADLTEAQRTGALAGSAQQAQQYFDAAIKTWTALVEKATANQFDNAWVDRARAALRGEGVPPRERAP